MRNLLLLVLFFGSYWAPVSGKGVSRLAPFSQVEASQSLETFNGYRNFRCLPVDDRIPPGQPRFVGGALQIIEVENQFVFALFQGVAENFEPPSEFVKSAMGKRPIFGRHIPHLHPERHDLELEEGDGPFWSLIQNRVADSEIVAIQPLGNDDLISKPGSKFLRQLSAYAGDFEDQRDLFIQDILSDSVNIDELLEDASFWFDFTFSYDGYLLLPKSNPSETYPSSFRAELYLTAGIEGDNDLNPIPEQWRPSEIAIRVSCNETGKAVEDILKSLPGLAVESGSEKGKKTDSEQASLGSELPEGELGASAPQVPLHLELAQPGLRLIDSKAAETILKNALLIHTYSHRLKKQRGWAATSLMMGGGVVAWLLTSGLTKAATVHGFAIPLLPFLSLPVENSIPIPKDPSISFYHIIEKAENIGVNGLNNWNWPTAQEQGYLEDVAREISKALRQEYDSYCRSTKDRNSCI